MILPSQSQSQTSRHTSVSFTSTSPRRPMPINASSSLSQHYNNDITVITAAMTTTATSKQEIESIGKCSVTGCNAEDVFSNACGHFLCKPCFASMFPTEENRI